MTTVMLEEAKERLETLLAKVADGEEVIITREDGSAYKIVPAPQPQPRAGKRGLVGSAKGEIWMSEDFDEPLEFTSEKPRPVFGSGKGWFTDMADDFDEPLEDFEDYMS